MRARQAWLMHQITFFAQRTDVIGGGRHAAEAELARDFPQRGHDTTLQLAGLNELQNLLLSGREAFHKVWVMGWQSNEPVYSVNARIVRTRPELQELASPKKFEAALAIQPKHPHAYAAFPPARDFCSARAVAAKA